MNSNLSLAALSEEWIRPFAPREDVRIKTNEKFTDYYDLYEEIGE